MARHCELCGRGIETGMNVSKSNNRSHRRWMPNLQPVRVQAGKSSRRIRVCTRCIHAGKVQKARPSRRPQAQA